MYHHNVYNHSFLTYLLSYNNLYTHSADGAMTPVQKA